MNPATAPPDYRDRKRFYYHATWFRRTVVALLRILFMPVMKLEVHGLEHLPGLGAVVVACNHVTNFDVFPIQLSLPRPIFFMGKAELFTFPPLDWALRNLGAFPVHRGEKDAWAMRHARVVLEHGQVLGMFPEGTRNKGRGLGVAKTGTARLAIETNCPIVPIVVVGSDQFFMRFPHRTNVLVSLLTPIWPRPTDSPLELTDRLMFAMAEALPEDMRGVYTFRPDGFVK
jgi:1-acyl-sn-glycerol-3-phosphate acyltransferase